MMDDAMYRQEGARARLGEQDRIERKGSSNERALLSLVLLFDKTADDQTLDLARSFVQFVDLCSARGEVSQQGESESVLL